MARLFSKMWNDKRGNVLVIMGATLPLLIGAAGLATDTIEWSLWKRQLQRSADSAALAGVYTRIGSDSQSAVETAVTNDLAINYHVGTALATGYPKVKLVDNSGDMKSQVRVTLQMSKSLPFSSVFMDSPPVISAVATAASVPGADEFCVLATDKRSTVSGITVTGSAYIDIGGCSMMANSAHPTAAADNGNSGNGGAGSTLKAKSLAAVGGVNYSRKGWSVDDYDPNSPALDDPLANVSPPTCTKHVTVDMTKNQSYPMDRTKSPNLDAKNDVVCFDGSGGKTGLKVQGTLKLQDGVSYVINGGDLTMSSTGSSMSCSSCTIFMTNTADPTKTGNVNITGGTLSIKAPTDGTYQGIAFFQDRRATDNGGNENTINGNNGASIDGTVYMGNRGLSYSGGSQTVMACLQLVSKRVTFTGNSGMALSSTCGKKIRGVIGGGRRVRLVA